MEAKGSGGGSSRKPPSAWRTSCEITTEERDGRIERSKGLLCDHLPRAPSENSSLPASQLIQSGCCFFEQSLSNVECQLPSVFPAATKDWGYDQMLNDTYAFHASPLYNELNPNFAPNRNLLVDHMRSPSSALIETNPSNNSTNLCMEYSDFRSISRVMPTFPAFCSASERGMSMNFFQNEPSYAMQNRNLEEPLRSMTCRVVQSNLYEEPQTRQIPGHPILHNSTERCDDQKFGGSELQILVRKELTNSDVGTVGRIVLPKKEAEANLPPLIERDGIMLHMNDLVLPVTWKFKYRFWPNNRSRMYILETTGDFVKAHGLRSGDVFIIYRSPASGNYIVTGEQGAQCSAPVNTFDRRCKIECSKNGDCKSSAWTTT